MARAGAGEGNCIALNRLRQYLVCLVLEKLGVRRLSGIDVIVDDIVKQELHPAGIGDLHRGSVDGIGRIFRNDHAGIAPADRSPALRLHVSVLFPACRAANPERSHARVDRILLSVIFQTDIAGFDSLAVNLHRQLLIEVIRDLEIIFRHYCTARIGKLHPHRGIAALRRLKAVDAVRRLGGIFIPVIRNNLPCTNIVSILIFQHSFGGIEISRIHAARGGDGKARDREAGSSICDNPIVPLNDAVIALAADVDGHVSRNNDAGAGLIAHGGLSERFRLSAFSV